MKKHVTVCSVLVGIALTIFVLATCSSGSGDEEPPATTYPITVLPTGATGSEAVTANVTEAEAGTTVTLTATLGSGRRVALNAASVPINSSTISVNGGTATFMMPNTAVTITATYSFTPTHPAGYAESHTANSTSFNMHYVPSGGTFIMGEHVETTTQTVTLTKNFWMGETEVTQGLWEAVWGTTWPGTDPDGSGYGAGASYPAYFVNWYDAVAFCNLLTIADSTIADTERVYYYDADLTTVYTKTHAANHNKVYIDWSKKGYRLPTSAEWEYTARYVDGTSWTRGDHVSGGPVYTDETDPDKIGDYAWYFGNNGAIGSTTYANKEVGQKKANALGLRDMSGNVWEMCSDWWVPVYSVLVGTDPVGPSTGMYPNIRGGTWEIRSHQIMCALNGACDTESSNTVLGFRLCRTAD